MRSTSESRRDRRLIYLLNVAQRRLQRFVGAQTKAWVTSAQGGLLFVLVKHDGALIGEVGAAQELSWQISLLKRHKMGAKNVLDISAYQS